MVRFSSGIRAITSAPTRRTSTPGGRPQDYPPITSSTGRRSRSPSARGGGPVVPDPEIPLYLDAALLIEGDF